MTTEISQDIFFTVKKQILDKLDLILQRINLELIQKSPSPENFTYIQLSEFQNQIAILFKYLDKLYQSLNTSVSMSNFYSIDNKIRQDNQKLIRQNLQLKEVLSIRNCQIQCLKKQREKYKKTKSFNIQNGCINQNGKFSVQRIRIQSTQKRNQSANYNDQRTTRKLQNQAETPHTTFLSFKQQSYCVFLLKDMLPKVRQDCIQMLQFLVQIRNQIKQYKFCILQSKVQFLSKVKDMQKNLRNIRDQSIINDKKKEAFTHEKAHICKDDSDGFSRRVLLRIEAMLQSK